MLLYSSYCDLLVFHISFCSLEKLPTISIITNHFHPHSLLFSLTIVCLCECFQCLICLPPSVLFCKNTFTNETSVRVASDVIVSSLQYQQKAKQIVVAIPRKSHLCKLFLFSIMLATFCFNVETVLAF